MLALASINNWDIRQMDVKSAYLNGSIDEEIYMKQPIGFEDKTGRVCRLQRSLYGLKQAGNIWNREFSETMEKIGFTKLKTNYCCFIRRQGEKFAIILVWVDDLVIFTDSPAESNQVEKELTSKFDIKVIGEPSMLLGMKISRNMSTGSITLSQTHYIDAMLKKFGLTDANPVTTPLDPHVRLDDKKYNEETHSDEQSPNNQGSGTYATAIGSLMYAALGTRPDIAYAVKTLAQYMQNPQPIHWTAVKQIFRYLKGTCSHMLTYDRDAHKSTIEIEIYCDADWASNTHRKSISGYVFLMAGGAVAWSSKEQSTIVLSTAEAEYTAATHAVESSDETLCYFEGFLIFSYEDVNCGLCFLRFS
jgi:hypothetical protein